MNTTKMTLKLYWSYAWRYRVYVIGLLIMVPVGGITFRLLPPLFAAKILQQLASHQYEHHGLLGSFTGEVVSYAAITILGGVVAWRIIIFLIWKLEGYVVRDLYRAMFDQFMRLSASYHANNLAAQWCRKPISWSAPTYACRIRLCFSCISCWLVTCL